LCYKICSMFGELKDAEFILNGHDIVKL